MTTGREVGSSVCLSCVRRVSPSVLFRDGARTTTSGTSTPGTTSPTVPALLVSLLNEYYPPTPGPPTPCRPLHR